MAVGMNRVTGVETAAVRQLLDDTLPAFYDLTTIRIQGGGRVKEDLRTHGPNERTCGIIRQLVLGVSQRAQPACVARSRLRSGKRCSSN